MTTGNITAGVWGEPSYDARIWSGEDDPEHARWNNFFSTRQKYVATPTQQTRDSDGAFIRSFYAYNQTGLMASVIDPNLELKVLSQITDDARMHSFNAGIVLAELNQTTGLILTTLNGLRGIVQGTRQGDISMVTRAFAAMTSGRKLSTIAKSKVTAKDISGTILATYYGWFPLFSDIYEAMRAMNNRAADPRFIKYRHGGQSADQPQFLYNPGLYGYGNPANAVYWQGSSRLSYVVEFHETLSVARSLGVLNPALVLWEMLPWSFVFDWFIPISTYLDNLGVLPFLDLRFMRSELRLAEYVNWNAHAWVEWGYTYKGGSISGQNVIFNRSIGTQLSVPTPSFKTFEAVFSLAHIRNAAALVHQGLASANAHSR